MKNHYFNLIGLFALAVNITDLIIKLGQVTCEYFFEKNMNEEYLSEAWFV